jgi:hypothetical protein
LTASGLPSYCTTTSTDTVSCTLTNNITVSSVAATLNPQLCTVSGNRITCHGVSPGDPDSFVTVPVHTNPPPKKGKGIIPLVATAPPTVAIPIPAGLATGSAVVVRSAAAAPAANAEAGRVAELVKRLRTVIIVIHGGDGSVIIIVIQSEE